ncbi:MAG: hypothetical protein BM563_09245 [Bacteroidetes bacterium MedPE-SWsnd-G1]|nr:MAG: hypothetical protein BM563_09245 [Bacteroidetes bacterium MedPE-SWsnd-G1]
MASIEKSIVFVLFIILGLLLKSKFKNKEELKGIKTIILSLALPATIFLALLKINISSDLIILPAIALLFNVFLYAVTPVLLHIIGVSDAQKVRTAKLLVSSLAPGLSCFPFILEFLGEDMLANAAMADLGNKFFVLIVLYIFAINWHYKRQNTSNGGLRSKILSLLKVLILEPVNICIGLALVLLSLNLDLASLPLYIQELFNRLSSLMTPLVLLFIGLAVKYKRKEFAEIFSILMFRAGISLLLVVAFVTIFNVSENVSLFMVVFSLSSCSFWPFAHISSIALKERNVSASNKTFNSEFALAILALSLPISVALILAIFTAGATFKDTGNLLLLALTLFALGSFVPLYRWMKKGAQVKQRYKNIDLKNKPL